VTREPGWKKTAGARETLGLLAKPASLSERLLNAILSISGCATLDEALEPLLAAALDVTRMDGGGVYWVQDDVAVLRYHRGLPEAFIREVSRMPLTLPVQTVLEQREPTEVADISPVMQELLHRHGIRHAFSLPLRAHGILFGFLNVGSTRAQAPARTDLQALWVLVKEVESLFFRLYSEKALRESEQRYRTLWESALDAIALYELYDPPREGRFIDVNDCACRMLGYSREEILALSPFDVVAENARTIIPRLLAKVWQAGRMLFEITLVAKDGRPVPVEANASLLHLDGQHLVLVVVRDITERRRAAEALRESEERFRAFMDNSPAIAWMKDEEGRYVYISEACEKRFGVPLDDCRGKTDFELWPQETAAEFRRNDQEVLRTGRTIKVVEGGLMPDGQRSYWWNFKFLLQDAAGRKFVGGIGVDITERKRMETLLQEANEHLEGQVQARTGELNRTVEQLRHAMEELKRRAGQLQKLTLEVVEAEDRERKRLAGFLHDDLQQTLAAAKFHLSILGGQLANNEPARENLGHIRQMLADAIQKSRNLSHELGPPVLYQGKLGDVFEWLGARMGSQHGLTVEVDIHNEADSNSEAVRSFLFRTAQEILFNVAKHAQVRHARLRLQRVRNALWLTISDKGRGFDPTSLARTSGLGLSTARERAELLGGHLTIKSTPGQGSIFFITVPDGSAGEGG